MAASCSDCPNENGPSGCDGDCMWGNSTVTGEQCILKGKLRSNALKFLSKRIKSPYPNLYLFEFCI